jgi:hypothetical protein
VAAPDDEVEAKERRRRPSGVVVVVFVVDLVVGSARSGGTSGFALTIDAVDAHAPADRVAAAARTKTSIELQDIVIEMARFERLTSGIDG